MQWRHDPIPANRIRALSQQLGVSDILAELLLRVPVGTETEARTFLERRVREIQLTPVGGGSFIHAFASAGRAGGDSVRGANVVGMVRGRTKPESYIVVSAHYDHVGVRDG